MRGIFATFCLTMALTGMASGAEINVRSGAHPTFARIVLDVPEGTNWTVQQGASGARVTIDNHADGFDISNVFDRIDQTYVEAVEADATTLDVKFGCRCLAQVYPSGPNMIVVDVAETDQPFQDDQPVISTTALQFVGDQQLQFSQPGAISDPTDLPAPMAVPELDLARNVTPSPLPAQIIEPQYEDQSDSLNMAQQKLAEHIGLAATTGILRANRQWESIPDRLQRPQIDTRVFDVPAPAETVDPSNELLNGNLRISTSRDVSDAAMNTLATSTSSGARCIDPSEVQVQNWEGPAGFAASIAALRRELFSEFDTLEAMTAVELARTYLHYGFGAEAQQVLLMSPKLASENRALVDIARIMEFGFSGQDSYLANFVDCDSDVALWAILSIENLQPTATIDSSAAIRALSGLPIHLRHFLAPNLSKKLLVYGDQDAAAAALRGLERTSEPLPSAGELVKADIELATGDVEAARTRLEGIVASNDQQSAEALIRYVDTHLEAEQDIEEDIATLVEAYAIEMRNDPLGEELQRTHVLALAKSGQFDAAFHAMTDGHANSDVQVTDTLFSSATVLLARNADDATFLEHAFAAMTARSDRMSVRALMHLAARLTRLGFYTEAEELFSTRPDMPATKEYRVLRATVSLGLEKPREAMAFLGRLDGEEPDRLRARAREMSGDYEVAHELYGTLGDDDGQRQTAWLSEDWQRLLETNEPVLGAAVDVASSNLDLSTDVEGMLGRTQDALEESGQARDAIQQLLQVNDFLGEN
ncbi:hypothetical protein [uncultured Tateyamaria sp.]|uniref:hypothetical protein n=1 Tax=uncultured Tateyamaria sp. TaxID=455651 RepID=UPI002633C4F7|nr:hypothetical protein [uncultured Tateyamaria sp.]